MPHKRARKPQGPRPTPVPPPPRPEPEDAGDEGPQDLGAVFLERAAEVAHPELVLALQERAKLTDGRWLALAALGLDAETGTHPLVRLQPVSLSPLTFAVDAERGDADWLAEKLLDAFGAFPVLLGTWQARLSHAVITALGEERCAALGRAGMGEVVGAVEQALGGAAARGPTSLTPAPLPLDRDAVGKAVEAQWPLALARTRLAAALGRDLPAVDDEEIETLVEHSTLGLEAQVGPAPGYPVEVRAPGREWLPLDQLRDVLKRRMAGGLRVLNAF